MPGKEGEQNQLVKRRGKERGPGTGNLRILSSPRHQTNPVASTSKSESGLPRARSWRRLRPCLLLASQLGTEVEKLTSSLNCQSLTLPGHWSSQCPHSQTGRAQVCADSTGPANCGVILGPRGASQSSPDASKCCRGCQSGNAPLRTQGLWALSSNSPTRALLERKLLCLEGEAVRVCLHLFNIHSTQAR